MERILRQLPWVLSHFLLPGSRSQSTRSTVTFQILSWPRAASVDLAAGAGFDGIPKCPELHGRFSVDQNYSDISL